MLNTFENVYSEVAGSEPPAAILELMARRDTLDNDVRELLTAVEPESARDALTALYELHREESRLLLELLRRK